VRFAIFSIAPDSANVINLYAFGFATNFPQARLFISWKNLLNKKRRIEIIDILRGFALLGIIIVHFIEQYYAGQPPDSVKDFSAKNIADNIAQGFSFMFITGKFFMIFSFLFGLSFSFSWIRAADLLLFGPIRLAADCFVCYWLSSSPSLPRRYSHHLRHTWF